MTLAQSLTFFSTPTAMKASFGSIQEREARNALVDQPTSKRCTTLHHAYMRP